MLQVLSTAVLVQVLVLLLSLRLSWKGCRLQSCLASFSRHAFLGALPHKFDFRFDFRGEIGARQDWCLCRLRFFVEQHRAFVVHLGIKIADFTGHAASSEVFANDRLISVPSFLTHFRVRIRGKCFSIVKLSAQFSASLVDIDWCVKAMVPALNFLDC